MNMSNALPSAIATPEPDAKPAEVKRWFEASVDVAVPAYDGTLNTARKAAEAFGRKAKSANTRRAYRAGVRAFCAWCERQGCQALPAAPEDVAAFLAEERQLGRTVATIDLRRAAIRYLHWLAGVELPTGQVVVALTVSGIRHDAAEAGERPAKKLAATVAIIQEIVDAIPSDLTGLRDRALILVGFVGALRSAELAKIRAEHLTARERGLELFLPLSKGDRQAKGVTVPLPFGKTVLCPVRALRAWQEAAGITEGPVFRRIWRSEAPKTNPGGPAHFVVGTEAMDGGTVRRIVKRRGEAVGIDPETLGSHSLKRGAMTTGMENHAQPARLKRLGRHKSYAVMDEYLEFGDLFESHPLNGLI
ncbi:MAG: tyrosine-type recombinase/integrase [Desulfovibrio sp.]|uniref:site-specific integrase n=1 Tax=Desulfovibrio sp. TaxID=885 RepID=UPI00135DFDFE|nr:site-specific integrase [Desulfovibrio sp.]MTJ93980.1 tyrosine-type recombinase/integrase [Desulfovibrio sp.]